MRQEFDAVLLRIHLNEDDRFEGKPLHEVIVDICSELRIAGVTGFRGLAGFGASEVLHRQGVLGGSRSAPVVLTVVDTEERVAELQQKLGNLLGEGVVVASPVRAIRLTREGAAEE